MKTRQHSRLQRIENAAQRLEDMPLFPLLAAVYFFLLIPLAARKLIWDDEFFSLYIARGGFDSIWQALLTGADQHPPLFYWLTHLSLELFSPGHVSLRLPALLGMLLAAYCLYRFVAFRSSKLYGIAASLLVLVSEAFYYAYEARGYGLVLGFSALALLGWQRAGETGRARLPALLALVIGLCGAVSSHYYALLVVGPLALGEVVRWYERRRADYQTWAALATPLIVLALYKPVISSAAGYSKHFWAKPRWHSALSFFDSMLDSTVLPALITAVLVLGYTSLRGGIAASDQPRRKLPLTELAVALGLIALPLVAVVGAKLLTKGFHPRYVLPAVLGASVLLIHGTHALCRGSRVAAMFLCAALLFTFSLRGIYIRFRMPEGPVDLRRTADYLDAQGFSELPIAVAEVSPFHQLAFYAPQRLAERLYYLADPDSAIKYLGHDTIDRGLLDLRPWFPLQTIPIEEFLASHREFLVYGYIGEWSWLTYRLSLEDALQTSVIGRYNNRLLFLVRPPNPQGETEADGDSRGVLYRDEELPLRFSAAQWETSLCSRWMGDEICRMGTGEH